jgi:hypothetical protein
VLASRNKLVVRVVGCSDLKAMDTDMMGKPTSSDPCVKVSTAVSLYL